MKKIIILMLTVMANSQLFAQVKIGDNPSTISPGSLLELESTSKALTLPRMTTTQMQAIPSPTRGMIVFNLDSNCIYFYKSGNVWAAINAQPPVTQPWPYISNDSIVGTNGNGKGIISASGSGLVASGNYSHAEGLNSIASGVYAWSVGNTDTASGNASFSMGIQNKATGLSSFALGYKNISAGQSSIAVGQENYDSGWASLAAGHKNSVAVPVSYSSALGYNNQVRNGWSNSALGEGNIIKGGKANSTLGILNITNGNYNSLLGNSNEAVAGNSNLLSGEKNIVTSGNSNTVLGFSNTAAGNYNLLSGNINNIITGTSNLLSGEGNIITAGSSNALFGLSNNANANFSVAIGKLNTVFYQSAVAMGQGNLDSGWASITGGVTNVIENNVLYSSSFGINNRSYRNGSLLLTIPGAATFSAGANNMNSGYSSIALGGFNIASNLFSLAANHNTISNSYGMSAFGHYNDTTTAYPGENYDRNEMLFAIGNGISNSARRNSFSMLRNGFTSINATTETGPNIPRAELDVKGTGAIIVPVGTTAQRPDTPVVGMIRFCSDCGAGGTGVMQGYNGNEWVNL